MQSSSNQRPEQNYQEILDSIEPDLLTLDEPLDVPNISATLSPKGSIRKPIKRRSRASKKVPTTHLKADVKNFRALVQQFTGCHSPAPAFRSYKGPINLNFKQCTYSPENKNKEKQQQKQKQKQSVDHNYKQYSYSSSINNAAPIKIDYDELFISRDDDRNPRAEALAYYGKDVEEIWGQELSESGEYPAVLPGTIDQDGFLGY